MERSEKVIAIIGLTEAIKQYGLPSPFAPTVAIIIGVIISYAEQPNAQGVLEGLLLGGTVTGGYAITKRAGQGLISPFTNTKKPNTQKATNPEPIDYSLLEADDDRGV